MELEQIEEEDIKEMKEEDEAEMEVDVQRDGDREEGG